MKTLDRIRQAASKTGATLASFIKVALMSRRPSPRSRENRDTIIIMGNGPSLRYAMEHDMDVLLSYPRLAVNLSALAPEFRTLRPQNKSQIHPATMPSSSRRRQARYPRYGRRLAASTGR